MASMKYFRSIFMGVIFTIALLHMYLYYHQHTSRSLSVGAKAGFSNNKPFSGAKSLPFSILYCIASSGLEDRLDVVETLLDNAQDWCEAGHSVHVIIDTYLQNTIDTESLAYNWQQSRPCARNNNHFSVIIIEHELPAANRAKSHLITRHRLHFQRYLSQKDIFIFTEDDISLRLSTLHQWIAQSLFLGPFLSSRYMLGILRYENTRVMLRQQKSKNIRAKLLKFAPHLTFESHQTTDHSKYTPHNRVVWELDKHSLQYLNRSNTPLLHHPSFHHIRDNSYVQFIAPLPNSKQENQTTTATGPYAAMNIFFRAQLTALDEDCDFLRNQTVAVEVLPDSQEFYSSLQPTNCGNAGWLSTDPSYEKILAYKEAYCCRKWIYPVFSAQLPSDGHSNQVNTISDNSRDASLFVHHVGTPGVNSDNKWANRHRAPQTMLVTQLSQLLRNLSELGRIFYSTGKQP